MVQPSSMPRNMLRGIVLSLIGVILTAATVTSTMDSDGDELSDDFEGHWGASSAGSPDSDGDGLIDAAEDLDGDGLSALGEQRYGTDPGNVDSDADGIPDGDEDWNADGVSDAQQQDLRQVPRDLRPTTAMAWWDRPDNYDDGCHNDAVDTVLHTCRLAALGSDVRVDIFGDSHALQWLPALVGAGDSEGWEVVALTKAACPPAQVQFGRKEVGAADSCAAWRQQVLAWLTDDPPDVLLLTGAGRGYKLIDAEGARLPDEAALAEWQHGLGATLQSLPDSTTVIVLADTPQMRSNPVSCLEANPGDISACVTPRQTALGWVLDEAERATAEAAGASFESLNHLVCPYDPCPVIVGDTLMWRNADHITATFAEQLAPSMRELVSRSLLGRRAAGAPDPG